jgi:chromosome segregation ATPase
MWTLPQHTVVTPVSVESTPSQRDQTIRIQCLENEVSQLQGSVAEHLFQNQQKKKAFENQIAAYVAEMEEEKRKNEHDRTMFAAQVRTLRQRVKKAEAESSAISVGVNQFRASNKELEIEIQKLRTANEELQKRNAKVEKRASNASRLRSQRDHYRQDLHITQNGQDAQKLRTTVVQQRIIIDRQATDLRECTAELNEIRYALRLRSDAYPEDVVDEIKRLRRRQNTHKGRRTNQIGGLASLIERLFG